MLGRPADDFVADFVGSSRGLRRLAVTPIDPAHLEPLDGVTAGDLAGAIDVDSTLEEALSLLMREDKPVIGVRRGPEFLGVLTPNGIHKALRASVPVDAANMPGRESFRGICGAVAQRATQPRPCPQKMLRRACAAPATRSSPRRAALP